ncbi:hypothetical protein [Pontibacter diazotrophicus]|nr:hypothetical protein [Pontibacter diazotrophicus]
MTKETVFNREVADLIRRYPSWKASVVISEYMKQHSEKNCYEALQRLGAGIGIEHHVMEVISPRTGKVKGYWPSIKYSEGNPRNGRKHIMKFMHAPYQCPIKCHDYLARQYVYELNDTPNLAKHVFRENVGQATQVPVIQLD